MLPPLPPLLQSELDAGLSNLEKTSIPAFVNLYRHLTTQTLDHDVSTRRKNDDHERSGIAQRLKQQHEQLARNAILTRALREICSFNFQETGLSRDTRELCYVISSLLSSVQTGQLNIDDEAENLMAGDIIDFQTQLPTVSAALTNHFARLESTIGQMLEALVLTSDPNPVPTQTRIPSSQRPKPTITTTTTSTTRTYKPTTTPTPPTSSTHLTTHLQTLNALTSSLPHLTTTLSQTLTALLTTHTSHLTSSIRHAELHTHSTRSRHLTSNATFLASVSQGLSLKAQILALQREKEVYANREVVEGLKGRFEKLSREERTLEERDERLRGLVGEFVAAGDGAGARGDGEGGRGMEMFEQLGRVYRDVEEEIEVVRGDVRRLMGEVEKLDLKRR